MERLDDGPLAVGASARVHQPALGAAVWAVTAFEPGRSFSWRSARRGIAMTGTHRVETDDDGCRSTLELEVSGPLGRVLAPLIAGRARRTLARENEGFRDAAERAQRSVSAPLARHA